MNRFSERDNQERIGMYRKDEYTERLFREMNRALMPLENPEPEGIDRPTIFIFGLPRSGTTLTYQLTRGRKIRSFLFSDQLLLRFSGKGRIWLQSRSPRSLAAWVYPYRPVESSNS